MSVNASRGLAWKVVAVVFVILTIGTSGAAYYYYQQTQTKISNDFGLNNQIQQLQAWLDGNKTQAADYQAKISKLQSQLEVLGNLNASQTAALDNDKTVIANLQSNNADIQSQLAQLQTKYGNLLTQNMGLTNEVNALTIENIILGNALHAEGLVIGNLTQIVNLQVSKVLANKVTLPWSGGDTIQISEATTSYNFSGYVSISWSSTQSLTFKLAYTVKTNSTSVTSNSSSKDTFSVPVIGSPSSPTPATASFHNDGCSIFGCPSGTVTYTITYWY
jgi:hypothetical protein